MVSLIYCIDFNVERQNFYYLFCIRYCIVIDNDHIDTSCLNWRNLHLTCVGCTYYQLTHHQYKLIYFKYFWIAISLKEKFKKYVLWIPIGSSIISIDEGVQMLLLFKLIFSCYGLVWWLWTKYLHLGNEVPPESYSSYLLHSLIRIM